MGFVNPILGGGGALVRPAIKSPNYVPGVAGWEVNRIGNAEFNDVVLRGSILASVFRTALAGRRIVINEDNSESMELYDDDDNLMMTIGDDAGTITSYDVNDGSHAISFGEAMIQFLFDSGGGILSPIAELYNVGNHVLLNTVLSGGVGFDASRGVLSQVNAGSNSLETWHAPAYQTNWGASTTFGASTSWGPAQIRLDAEGNVVIIGGFKAGATVPGTSVLQLPVGYRPSKQWPIAVQRNNGGAVSYGMAEVGPSGFVNLLAANGMGVAAGNEYLIAGTFPLA